MIPTPEEIKQDIEDNFKKNIKPLWDEIGKHCVWRSGGSAIYDFRKEDK